MTNDTIISKDWLASQKCVPCEGGVSPFTQTDIAKYLHTLHSDWAVLENKKIQREFKFDTFKQSIEFVNKVAEIAEEEGHHPDITIHYNKVVIQLWTHAIDGLSQNDFILATKIDKVVMSV